MFFSYVCYTVIVGGSMKFMKKIFLQIQVVPFKKWMTIAMFFSCILGYVIMAFFPYFASQIINYATVSNFSLAFMNTIWLGLSYILYECVFYINYYLYSKLQEYYCTALYDKLFHKIYTSSRGFSSSVDKGKILSLVGDDIVNFCLLLDSLTVFLSTIFMVFLVFFLVFKAHFIFAIIILISTIFYILFIIYNTKRYTLYFSKQKRQHDFSNNIYVEELNALKEIKTLPIQDKLWKKLHTVLNRYTRAYYRKRKYLVRNQNTSNLFPQYTKVVLYLVLLGFMVYFHSPIGMVVLIIGYYDQLMECLSELLTSYQEIKEYTVSIERVFYTLNYNDSLDSLFGQYEGNEVYGAIDFRKVSYLYNSKYVLNQVSFSIQPNTLNVIVGESGSGKTTLFDLLLRFYPISEGKIYLDGRDIYDYSSRIYASNITMVKQNPFFYNMSIYQNLRLVNGNKKKQVAVCKEVGIHDFIMSLKKNYSTVLRQNARNLSGGQKQLLAIARALLTDAEILLMDDIMASLDPKTTLHIISLLKRLKIDHTILVITNREDLIREADQIIYLENGRASCYKTMEEWKSHINYEESDLI